MLAAENIFSFVLGFVGLAFVAIFALAFDADVNVNVDLALDVLDDSDVGVYLSLPLPSAFVTVFALESITLS